MASDQERNKQAWRDLIEVLNRGDFGPAMDEFFHPDFEYDNASRPDLRSYAEWKKSPMHLYATFPPHQYTVADIAAEADKVWVYCTQHGFHTGGPYMGVQPSGNQTHIEWFSIVTFKDGKIIKIFSIADLLAMFMQIGVLDESFMPVQPDR